MYISWNDLKNTFDLCLLLTHLDQSFEHSWKPSLLSPFVGNRHKEEGEEEDINKMQISPDN